MKSRLLTGTVALLACGPHEDETGSTSDTSDGETEAVSRLYFSLVAHNEDTNAGNNQPCLDFFGAPERWIPNQEAFAAIVADVRDHGAAFSLQSDVEYLKLVETRESASDNILRRLIEDGGGTFTVDAHAHETAQKNYADVANLVEKVAGTRNGVVGGFLAVTCEGDTAQPDWEKFREPLAPIQDGAPFQASLLSLGASAGHRCDTSVSGLWRPESADAFLVDDPSSSLPTAGTGLHVQGGELREVRDKVASLLAGLRAGLLEEGQMYTASVTLSQCNFDLEDSGHSPEDIAWFLDELEGLAAEGPDDFRWALLEDLPRIWRDEYGMTPSLYVVEEDG